MYGSRFGIFGNSSKVKQIEMPTHNGEIFSSLKVIDDYIGPLFNIRRSSDNLTIDVYHNGTNYILLDTYLYSDWISSNTGYVTIWYNQKNIGNNATQIIEASQPIFDYINNRINTRTSRFLNTPLGINKPAFTICCKTGASNSVTSHIAGGGPYTNGNAAAIYKYNNNTYVLIWWADDLAGGVFSPGNTIVGTHDGITRKLFLNGSQVSSQAKAARTGRTNNATIGGGNGAVFFNGDIYNVFIYDLVLSDSEIANLPI